MDIWASVFAGGKVGNKVGGTQYNWIYIPLVTQKTIWNGERGGENIQG